LDLGSFGAIDKTDIHKAISSRISLRDIEIHLKRGQDFQIFMAAHKSTPKKIRLMKKLKQNSPVPAWIIVRTKRRVRTNPKRRQWRRTDVGVGKLSEEILERIYTINLGKVLLSRNNQRSKRA